MQGAGRGAVGERAGQGVGDGGRDPRHEQGAGKGPKGKGKGAAGSKGQAGRGMGAREGGRAEERGSGSGSGWPYAIGIPRRQPHALPVESGRRRSRVRLYPEPHIATGGVQPGASLCWQGVR